MGVSLKTIRNLLMLATRDLLPRRGHILEFGAQNMVCSTGVPEVIEFAQYMRGMNGVAGDIDADRIARIANGGLMGELMGECGFDYTAIDIFPGERTLLFDLNTDTVPADLRHRFDLVTNFGTTEHVLNQYNCFLAAHEFTANGGIMYHDVPMGGYFFHGYFSYTPMFFMHIAQANDYETLYRYYWKSPGSDWAVAAPVELMEHGWPENWYQDCGIEFMFRKRNAAPFRLPVEVGTAVGAVDTAFLAAKREGIEVLAGAQDPDAGKS
jgi:hypothetical protein